LGCSPQTVVNMIKDGRLVGVDRGPSTRPRWLADRDGVEQLASGQTGRLQQPDAAVTRDLIEARRRIQELEQEVARLRRVGLDLNQALHHMLQPLTEETAEGADGEDPQQRSPQSWA
jgi:hypothetical protein